MYVPLKKTRRRIHSSRIWLEMTKLKLSHMLLFKYRWLGCVYVHQPIADTKQRPVHITRRALSGPEFERAYGPAHSQPRRRGSAEVTGRPPSPLKLHWPCRFPGLSHIWKVSRVDLAELLISQHLGGSPAVQCQGLPRSNGDSESHASEVAPSATWGAGLQQGFG